MQVRTCVPEKCRRKQNKLIEKQIEESEQYMYTSLQKWWNILRVSVLTSAIIYEQSLQCFHLDVARREVDLTVRYLKTKRDNYLTMRLSTRKLKYNDVSLMEKIWERSIVDLENCAYIIKKSLLGQC